MRTARASLGLLGTVALGLAVGAILDPELAGRLDVAAAFGCGMAAPARQGHRRDGYPKQHSHHNAAHP